MNHNLFIYWHYWGVYNHAIVEVMEDEIVKAASIDVPAAKILIRSGVVRTSPDFPYYIQ